MPPGSWSCRRRCPGGPRWPGAHSPRPTQSSPVPARPRRAARTHLAVELADRHDPAGRAEPGAPCPADCPRSCPGGRRVPAPRCPGGSQSTASPPGAIFLGWPRVCVFLVPFPRPVPPASWRRRDRLAPCRRDLYSRGSGVAAAGPELRAGGAGGRAAPLPAQVWEEVPAPGGGGREDSGRQSGRRVCRRAFAPNRAGLDAPSRVPAAAGSSGLGAGRARSGRRPPPAGRRAHAGQVRAGCCTCRATLRVHAGCASGGCAGDGGRTRTQEESNQRGEEEKKEGCLRWKGSIHCPLCFTRL